KDGFRPILGGTWFPLKCIESIKDVVFAIARYRLCCTNGERDSLFESSGVATVHEQLVRYEVQDQELAFVQHGAEAARFAINLV
uniref:hypothetical protein n=1 Tax=Phaeobacter italicus TaxID=481446 RepID=UPI00248EEEB9